MKRALVMMLSVLFVAGCGGGAKSQPTNTANAQPNPCATTAGAEAGNTGSSGASDADDGRIKTIKQLMASIDDKMKKLSPREAKGEQLDDTCAAIEVTDPCTSKCAVSADICKESEQVCTLAGELSGNAAAADQCKLGQDSCRRAEINCCECKQAG